MLIRIQNRACYGKTLGIRSGYLKMSFIGGRTSQSLACSAGMQNYMRYGISLLMLVYTPTMMLLHIRLL